MRRGGPGPAHFGRSRISWTVCLRVAVLALATAGVVLAAGGGSAFWVCVPAALLAGAWSTTRVGTALAAATVVLAAIAPMLHSEHLRPLPSPVLAALVPITSLAVLVAVRERLEHQRDVLRDVALSDPLTGVANRRLLIARIEYEIVRHIRGRQSFALVMLDLDGFKLLNDRFGHAAGDELLCDVAAALSRVIRAQDTVARIGGDEFCVLAPETDGPGTIAFAKRIARAVAGATSGVETLRASVGVAVFPHDGSDVQALLQAADQRLLSAKRRRHAGRQRRAA
jgi:diguanylate cyclase (GGDEF)-like protein